MSNSPNGDQSTVGAPANATPPDSSAPAASTSGPGNAAPAAKGRPKWLSVIALIAAVLILAGLIVPYFIDVDRYRASIATLISEQTGRQVTLGMIRARILPQVGFDVSGFHMNNPDGFIAGEFVSAEHVRGTLAFWPLIFHRELQLTSLELTRPRLVLLQNSHGGNNYTFSPASPAHAADMAAPIARYVPANFVAADPQQPADVPEVSSVLQVDELILRDATVVYGSVDSANHARPIVQSSGFSATLRHMQLQPLIIRAWRADGNLSGANIALANWNGPITFHSGTVTLQQDDLESTFSADFGKATRVDGSVSVPDVTHVTVKFNLQTTDINVDLLEAAARKANAAIHAADAITNDAEPDAPQIAGTKSAAPEKRSRVTLVSARSVSQTPTNAPAPAHPATEILAQGHLDAKKVHWGAYVAGPASADLRFYNDRVEMWPVTVRFAGGSLQASARTDSKQSPQRFAVNLEARNLSTEQLLSVTPSLRGKLAGTGELDLQVFGSLDAAWLQSLTGKGEFAVRNGRINGVNLSGVTQSVANLAGVSGNTTFTAITGDLDIDQQKISSRDIHLDSSLGVLDMKGSFGLNTALDYEGQVVPQLSSASGSSNNSGGSIADIIGRALSKNGVKITVPFALHGSLQHPEILPGHGAITFPAPAASHTTQTGLSYPNLFQQQAPPISAGGHSTK